MRTKHRLNFALTTGVAGIALLLGMSAAQADVILEIDVFSPTEINFIPTPAFAQNTVTGIPSGDAPPDVPFGIVLEAFFTGNSNNIVDESAIGDINVFNSAAGDTRRELDQFNVFSNNDLNIFDDSGGGFDMFFFDDKTALTGTSMVLDLSLVNGLLPTAGMSGDIFVGDQISSNIIGQWQVIPEPGTGLLLGLGLMGLSLAGRRRRRV
jgi:hypothetical protein